MPKKKSKEGKPEVHNELDGLELNIGQFGEIETSIPLDQINLFLNQHVKDKKLHDEDDWAVDEEE